MNQLVCRCCLLEQPHNVYNLFEHQLCEKLLYCVPILHIERDDGLPEIICDMCYLHLDKLAEFGTKCYASEVELKKRYDDTNKAIDEALRATDICSDSSFDNIDEFLFQDCIFSDFIDDVDELQDQSSNPFIDDFLHDVLENYDVDAILRNDNDASLQQQQLQQQQQNAVTKAIKPTNNEESDKLTEAHINYQKCISTTTTASKTTTETEIIPTTTSFGVATTKSGSFECLECGKRFTRNFQLKLHQHSVHNNGTALLYECMECFKGFASRSSLNYHIKSMHSQDRPFTCQYCSRQFILRTQLVSHLRVHTGETKPRTHACTICGKLWPTKSDLRLHMRSHNPDVQRPFKCDRCEKCFFSRGHLQSHILVHTGEKPYSCPICNKCYQSIGNLNNHKMRQHAELKES